ncbi:MAG: hypothetical protein IK082_09430 [Oscillospiraceae bacterium]|nr:hypothetical protein [Oscillospiraceae bacterium]
MIQVNVKGGVMTDAEKEAYVRRAREQYPDKRISSMDITLDGEYADITYHWETVPFERIRRITGYLVGTLDRFNNGKRPEEADRVKHGIS